MTRRTHIAACVILPPLLLLLATGGAGGQTLKPLEDTRREVGSPSAQRATSMPSVEAQPMPADSLPATTLDQALETLRNSIPNFNSVITREPSVPADYPQLPAMTLKNVTVGQFLQFVQASFPGVQIVRIDGPSGSLYAVRVRSDDAFQRARLFAVQAENEQNELKPNAVRVYRLTEVIGAVADTNSSGDKKRDQLVKEATADVLSLLHAALEQTGGDAPASLKIHEQTQTLLFKGSKAQQRVLEEAISMLTPPRRPQPTVPREVEERIAKLQDELQARAMESAEVRMRAEMLAQALAEAKRAADAAATTRPSKD